MLFKRVRFLYINRKQTESTNQTTKQSVFAISRKITQKQADNYQRRANRKEEGQREIRDDLLKAPNQTNISEKRKE